MNANHRADSRIAPRRGVVLILVLGMLALLALIGVTFATFASQSKIGARNFAQSVNTPGSSDLMDYALSQLINDTDNPVSAIRGHSLKRDMYGSDGYNNGLLTYTVNGPLYLTSRVNSTTYVTNIPYDPSGSTTYIGWVLKLAPTQYGFGSDGNPVPLTGITHTMQSFVVVADIEYTDASNNHFHQLQLSLPDSTYDGTPATVPLQTQKQDIVNNGGTSYLIQLDKTKDPLGSEILNDGTNTTPNPFILDGRYRFAFNGPGINDSYNFSTNLNPAQYGNFRFNGGFLKTGLDASTVATVSHGNTTYVNATANPPLTLGMDEDYDACDLENWFMAIQSADGQIVVPSFHRPGILSAADWSYTYGDLAGGNANLAAKAMSKILRPRSVDHGANNPFGNGVENPVAGQPLTLDVDNDGDGKTDSVWLDLGYAPRRNAQGKLYKPLFAFMVIGLNGRIPLNTAGNLAGRDDNGNPLSGQASHLGNSVSEVDPTYGLQNSFKDTYGYQLPQSDNAGGYLYNAGISAYAVVTPSEAVDVRSIQLQNILAGTRPYGTLPNPTNVIPATSPTTGLPTTPATDTSFGDLNYVIMGYDPTTNLPNLIYYLPNGVADLADTDVVTGQMVVAPLSSAYVSRATQPVGGRWGEAASVSGPTAPTGNPLTPSLTAPYLVQNYNNPARAGYSLGNRNVDDDNLNAFDPYGTSATRNGEIGDSDLYDSSASPMLAVERLRRFVTPADIDGSGRVDQWPATPPLPPTLSNGSDSFGRVAFLSYFRPPGLPGLLNPATGLLAFSTATQQGSAAVDLQTTAPFYGNNPLHGYDFYRFPALATATGGPQRVGGMPVNLTVDPVTHVISSAPPFTAGSGTLLPTYDNNVNGGLHTDGQNDADEMNLYAISRYDQPFGPSDLEWLYRSQDIDGYSLSSRLSQLAPISFMNTAPIWVYSQANNSFTATGTGTDGQRRRRLFSTDSWDLASYAWANDNPQNGYSYNSHVTTTSGNPADTSQTSNTSTPVIVNSAVVGYTSSFQSPLLHRDKKINLNYPLPVSNDPVEPVRQKWIRETYQTLKSILPPLATDTAEELADLSQFVVNIIDFRDPDCAMTRFVNTDITVTAATTTTSMTIALTTATVTNPYSSSHVAADGYLIQYGMEYNPIAINEMLAYSFMYNSSSSPTAPTYARDNRLFFELVNTLTASAGNAASTLSLGGFNYTMNDPYSGGSWDMVFTKDDPLSRPDPFTGQLLNATGSYYSLIPLNRDSFNAAEGAVDLSLLPLPLTGDPSASAVLTPVLPANPNLPLNYYCVIGNPSNAVGQETNEPTKTTITPISVTGTNAPTVSRLLNSSFDPLVLGTPPPITFYPGVLPGVTASTTTAPTNYSWDLPTTFTILGTAKKTFTPATDAKPLIPYYWACLRRPANPFAAVSATNPMIVVDSMRFPYIDATNMIDASGTPPAKPAVSPSTGYYAYSVQRWQPFRGGHAVPLPEAAGQIDSRYGFTEQMVPPVNNFTTAQLTNYGSKGIFDKNDSSNLVYATSPIYHSLGEPGGVHSGTGVTTEAWNYLPFNDRDFTSVAELLLVPGCSPGLFTKQFVELATGTSNSAALAAAAPQAAPVLSILSTGMPAASTQASNPFSATTTVVPTSSPYLVDKFFYSAANPTAAVTAPNTTADDQTSAGWHKMLEFFEVPSQSMGAYGTVAQGANFDWLRQDVRPGLVNLNLIVDEEVFFSVFGKQDPTYAHQVLNNKGVINTNGVNFLAAPGDIPAVVTSIDPTTGGVVSTTGLPPASYAITNNGFIDTDNANNTSLKPAFLEFLRLRHGGSGYLFAFGTGAVGTPNKTYTPAPSDNSHLRIAADRPFRSLSYPDIDHTIMRPASLPPSTYSQTPLQNTVVAAYANDPGLKNQLRYPGFTTGTAPAANILPPAIPAQRLFQPPDSSGNAGVGGDAFINTQTNEGGQLNGVPGVPNLVAAALGSGAPDNSQQPYFRTEMLQKAMNLTTVRTHQYAVWITVGFFEVTLSGNSSLIDSAPSLAYDQLGREIGINGTIVRYRGFYVVDRTKATGFNPASPGDYHDCVIYGHVIQ